MRFLAICCFSLIALLLPFSVLAEEDMTTKDDNKTITMETVTVTASKREGTDKEFPGNISVMDDVFMETHGTNTLGELARFAPNIYIKNTSSGGSIICRGISTIDTALFSPMGLYVDDAPYPMGYMANQMLFDVERVEVLRGPQGSLYGRNSESGVINVVLQQPSNEKRAKIISEVGTYMTARLGGSASGPIVEDTLFYGLSLLGTTTDGYNEDAISGDDEVTGKETLNGRGTLRWTPSDEWDITLNMDGATRDIGMSALRYEEGPNKTSRYKVLSNETDKAHETEYGQSARIKYSWSSVELTSISTHRNFDREHHQDSDRTATNLGYSDLDAEMDSWNQEFRLASKESGPLTWLLGVSGRYEDIDAGIAFTHVSPAKTSTRSGNSEDRGVAGFGQATYEIINGLRFTGGLRLDVSENEGKQTYESNSGTVSYKSTVDNTEWLPTLSLAYDFTPNVTAYTTYSQGFLAGGFNFYSATDEESFAYDAEHSTNYEAGIKTTWLNNTLFFNATVFYMDISDKQVREDTGGFGTWKFTNAAEAHTQGVELEGRYNPIPELQFTAGFGYADSVVDEWKTDTEDYTGNKVPWAPEYTYNLGVSYNHHSGFFALIDLLGTGEQYYDAANELRGHGYKTVNLKLGYQDDDMEISIWSKNLFDEEYAVKKVKSATGYTMVEDGAPQTFGITANWRF